MLANRTSCEPGRFVALRARRLRRRPGADRSFCAGYDLDGSPYTTPPEGGWDLASSVATLRDVERRYQRIWHCLKPTIAQVHGHAVAAGCGQMNGLRRLAP